MFSRWSKTWFCSVALGAALLPAGPTSVEAQDIGGVINLMGRVIEQDMRNQQMQREQRRYQAQQQAERAQQVRREVALVKRLQTALRTLGFYNSAIDGDRGAGTRSTEQRFTAAFELPPLDLSEDAIIEVEAYAATGFRSGSEMRRAASLGYERREDLLDGDKGGFDTAAAFYDARRLGFSLAEEFDQFNRSGFKSAQQFHEARAAGFGARMEFETAKAKGFSNKNEYDEYVQSGLPDRASFLAKREQILAIRKATDECISIGNAPSVQLVTTTMESCLVAVSQGDSSNQLSKTIAVVVAVLERELKKIEDQAADKGSSSVASTSTQGTAPMPADFISERARLKDALAAGNCASAAMADNWGAAKDLCEPAVAAAFPSVRIILAAASDEVAKQEKAKAEAEAQARKAAEEEQARLALQAAQQRMKNLIKDISEFSDTKRRLSNPLDVAKAVVALKALETSTDSTVIERQVLALDTLLKSEPEYTKFLDERMQAQDIARTNARATALSELQRSSKFIQDYVSRNMLSAAAGDLLTLQASIEAAIASGQDEVIFSAQKNGAEEIGRLGLGEEFSSFRLLQEPAPSKVEQANNGLAVTDGNRALLEGNPRDILILGNFTKSAPHLVVNLLGETAFYEGKADLCWYRARGQAPSPTPEILSLLKARGIETLNAMGTCVGDVLGADLVVLERGDFLQGDVVATRPIVEAFVDKKLRIVEEMLWSKLGEAAAQAENEAAQIHSEILAGTRPGYGFVTIKNTSGSLCAVAEGDAHQGAMASLGERFAKFQTAHPGYVVKTIDQAFMGLQRDDCSAVYAEAKDLKMLMEGLERAAIAYSVAPYWIDEDLLAEAQASIDAMTSDEQKRLAALRQEQEARDLQARKLSEDKAAQLAERQEELRAQYSQEAKAAFDGLSDRAEVYLKEADTDDNDVALLFPDLAEWKTQQIREGWLPESYADQMLDYGTADWKGRKLEAVVMKVDFVLKHPDRGEYSENCFIMGYLMDQEFKLQRDAFVDRCDVSQWHSWKDGRDFESRWVAE
jgi:hypothetical protein